MLVAEAVEHGINWLSSEGLIVLTNAALVVVTALAILAGIRENHRHEEKNDEAADKSEERLAKIVHQVLTEEQIEQHEKTEDEETGTKS